MRKSICERIYKFNSLVIRLVMMKLFALDEKHFLEDDVNLVPKLTVVKYG